MHELNRNSFKQSRRSRMAGVTLIELMIVVVVVAILGVIAVPSYREYVKRTHRTEAKSALLQIQTNQERWYLQNNSYTNDLNNLGFTGDVTENGVYALAITTAGGLTQDYTATATPTSTGGSNGVKMTDDDECTSFTLTSQGERTAGADPNGRCW
jgi:type IV pilus assembly protein PilE